MPMRILFIRHAEAVEADAFDGDDLGRPLTRSGRKKAAAAYARLFKILPKPDLIVSSEAVRAIETADLIHRRAKAAKRITTPLLNPGAGLPGFRKCIRSLRRRPDVLAIVGHEPDLSHVISQITAGGRLSLRLKKGACADVDVGPSGRGTLRALLALDALTDSR